jgi:hypothetical protein
MLLIPCSDCVGFGGWWEPAPEPEGWRWQVCATCHDTGQRWKCLDFMTCPGPRWYPLDARSAAILAAAEAANGGGND